MPYRPPVARSREVRSPAKISRASAQVSDASDDTELRRRQRALNRILPQILVRVRRNSIKTYTQW